MRNLEFDSRLLKLSPNPATVLKITKLCDKLPFAASYVGLVPCRIIYIELYQPITEHVLNFS